MQENMNKLLFIGILLAMAPVVTYAIICCVGTNGECNPEPGFELCFSYIEHGLIVKSGTNRLTCAQSTTYSCCSTDLCNKNSTDFGDGTSPSTDLGYESSSSFSPSTNFVNRSSSSTYLGTGPSTSPSTIPYNRAKINGMSFPMASAAVMIVLYQTI